MSSQEKNRASEEPEVKKNVPAGDTPEANVPERTAEAPAAPESRTDTDAKNPGADIKGPEKQEGPNPLEAELRAEKDRYLRLLAEFDNFRKRSQRERESIYTDIRSDTVLKFLPVYDNLLRALAMEGAENDPYRKGVELTMNQLNVVFEEMGIKEIRTLGEKFDPNLHCAVFHVEDSEKGEGEIVEELQKGFTLGDRVIRFSVVKVAN